MIYVTYHKYNFNKYIKMPCVTIKYFCDATNLVTIAIYATYQSING